MSMRGTACALWLLVGIAALFDTARADTFSGFSGVDRHYLVNQDRVCTPIVVSGGAASGAPVCEKAAADAVAHLSIKPPSVQSGAKATFAATASGRTITVSRKTGGVVVAWDAPDPVAKIVDVYASQYEDRVAVAYSTRRLGREVTDVIAFDLGPGQGQPAAVDAAKPPEPGPATSAPATSAPADDPALTKAVIAARAAAKPKAAAAWKAVLAIDPAHAEAQFRLAALDAAAKRTADAITGLTALAASSRGDAIEWLVEARFDPAFAALRADPRFRAAVGLDRKPSSTYERLMGFGGQWEQSGTSCDRPEVRFTAARDHSFKIRVKTSCEGSVYDSTFKGVWKLEADRVVLQLPNQGKVTASDEAGCKFESAGDEDALRCSLGRDIDFVVLPTRR
ncbi:MAG TPA: hypothetical protein VFP84_00625 [Kofleriaceae bacterium]|nr:hypothetical protein [Kofleriaceae bacterium]